jgi:murein DD-endopeptidase MepM/ murein hydrolase activator NlpD
VDTARDLAAGDPWQESLERSRARRERIRRARAEPKPKPKPEREPKREREPEPAREPEPEPLRAEHRHPRSNAWRDVLTTSQVWCEHAVAARSRLPRLGPKGVAGLALLAAIVASSLAKGGPQASTSAARADASRAAFISQRSQTTKPASTAAAGAPGGCPLAVDPTGYVNPLGGATVKPERIDQGVDYAGAGTLVAIGPATVTYVGTSNTGWPGAFIEFRLLAGADAGCYVFYAEGVVPVTGLTVGQQIAAGQPIATIIPKYPTGIELGWGSGQTTKAYAKVFGQWSPQDDHDNVATPAGRSFSDLIAALGGPPGKVEG